MNSFSNNKPYQNRSPSIAVNQSLMHSRVWGSIKTNEPVKVYSPLITVNKSLMHGRIWGSIKNNYIKNHENIFSVNHRQ